MKFGLPPVEIANHRPIEVGVFLQHDEDTLVVPLGDGDGGIQFTIGELASGVELGLPVPVIVWNNRGYGEIKHYMAERQIPQIGVDIYTPDFQTIARGFGCHAVEAASLAQLRQALSEAAQADRPTVIEVDDAAAQAW